MQKPLPTVTELALPGVRLITPRRFSDERGWFCETWQAEDWRSLGIPTGFVQDTLVFSARRGTLRGIHWQKAPYGQAKLIRCLAGAVLDVAADIRPGSPTFGKVVTAVLDAAKGDSLFIPAGYGHGYLTLADETLVSYRVDEPWHPEAEAACRWDDPTLAIDWGTSDPILSAKDRTAPFL